MGGRGGRRRRSAVVAQFYSAIGSGHTGSNRETALPPAGILCRHLLHEFVARTAVGDGTHVPFLIIKAVCRFLIVFRPRFFRRLYETNHERGRARPLFDAYTAYVSARNSGAQNGSAERNMYLTLNAYGSGGKGRHTVGRHMAVGRHTTSDF